MGVADSVPGRCRPVHFESLGLMKKFVVGAVLYPVSLVLGYVFTTLSERFEDALADIDYELDKD